MLNPHFTKDIFLSHRGTDKNFVRRLAGDIERETFQNRQLLTWLDEAEIRPGQSIPAMLNLGLETSRFIGIVMTPAYFESESGWTDAEWHSVLHIDPDNRRARLIPLLASDCPYIPLLLRHLNAIDFRGNRYYLALQELIRVLRDEPLPRPITYRGQLVTSGGRVDRTSLLASRAVPQADPDVVNEKLYCNLLPVEKLPQYVYTAPVASHLRKLRADGSEAMPSKNETKQAIRAAQEEAKIEHPFMPIFRLSEGRIITFYDLESPDGPFVGIVDDNDVEQIPTVELLRDEDDRKLVISLLNMAIDRHAQRVDLMIDETKQGRFFFPPKEGAEHIITWIPRKVKASRTVAKPCTKDGQVQFWRHQGAYLRMVFLANKLYLKITPTWVITEDGYRIKGGPKIGQLVIKWTGPERNLQVLYHIRFWTSILKKGPGPISIRVGDQYMELSTVPAFVQQTYGIANDQKDLMGMLDREAQLLAAREEEIADLVVDEEILNTTGVFDESDDSVEDIEEDSDAE